MEHPLWMLLPWGVFAVAAGLKFWRFSRLFRNRGRRQPIAAATGSGSSFDSVMTTEQFRHSLERLWHRDQEPG